MTHGRQIKGHTNECNIEKSSAAAGHRAQGSGHRAVGTGQWPQPAGEVRFGRFGAYCVLARWCPAAFLTLPVPPPPLPAFQHLRGVPRVSRVSQAVGLAAAPRGVQNQILQLNALSILLQRKVNYVTRRQSAGARAVRGGGAAVRVRMCEYGRARPHFRHSAIPSKAVKFRAEPLLRRCPWTVRACGAWRGVRRACAELRGRGNGNTPRATLLYNPKSRGGLALPRSHYPRSPNIMCGMWRGIPRSFHSAQIFENGRPRYGTVVQAHRETAAWTMVALAGSGSAGG